MGRRFTVDAKLGEGGMGVVLLATDTTLGRRVALKLLRAGSDSSAEQRARFMREAQVMARLTHENVVVVYEVGEHEGRTFGVERVELVSSTARSRGAGLASRLWAAHVGVLPQGDECTSPQNTSTDHQVLAS